jgi:hypothetical protein
MKKFAGLGLFALGFILTFLFPGIEDYHKPFGKIFVSLGIILMGFGVFLVMS